MANLIVRPGKSLRADIRVDGDKSITHRALIHAAIAQGTSILRYTLDGEDCRATLQCLREMGVDIHEKANEIFVNGKGMHGFVPPSRPLNCVRSGTTMRLLMGLLSGAANQPIVLDGDEQLRRRPMERVADPLRRLGAKLHCMEGKAPVEIYPAELRGEKIVLEVPSAQVKSAILYAALYAQGTTQVVQSAPTRDHTERLLRMQGGNVQLTGSEITVQPSEQLASIEMTIPGDLSSAAFPLAAAVLVPDSEVCIHQVGLNPSRTGILDVLQQMQAKLDIELDSEATIEPLGSICASFSALEAIPLEGDIIVRAIDEIPLAALLATQAQGETVIRNAAELRVKETDRIQTISGELIKMGALIEPTSDGMQIQGQCALHGSHVDSHGDHRIAMTLFIAGLIASGETRIERFDCVSDSFPGFLQVMDQMGARYEWI